ncbi:replication-associated recombination protein A [Ningiella sp. W23]|uniref:replication-associated recombination protein A n=1 Tax=Ningiella sp. W23 TaxID=3023715 RepID=UPI0037563D83
MTNVKTHNSPLANLLRPKQFDDYLGNSELMGENGLLRSLISGAKIPSMILWGPPGCGKTSIVNVIANELNTELISLSAISAGVKDIKDIAKMALDNQAGLFTQSPIVFVDEIHRFNKAQQDAFLPHVESGLIRLIGATTENPAFSINRALLSRMRVFTLHALNENELSHLCDRALQYLTESSSTDDREGFDKRANMPSSAWTIEAQAKAALIVYSNGDARRLLNAVELASDIVMGQSHGASPLQHQDSKIQISLPDIERAVGEKIAAFDKQGDHYYDLLSAFHKSIRGSAQDASLYWFARMLTANSDVTPICRRLLAIASEDIGNADPKALQVCLNAWDIYHRVGQAEGERAVAQAVIYCALAPKSNAVYEAFKAAKRDALTHHSEPVPFHLRNAPSQIAKDAGHGKDYVYPHNLDTAYATGVSYFPDNMPEAQYYSPRSRGFEKHLQQKIAYLKELEDNAR